MLNIPDLYDYRADVRTTVILMLSAGVQIKVNAKTLAYLLLPLVLLPIISLSAQQRECECVYFPNDRTKHV